MSQLSPSVAPEPEPPSLIPDDGAHRRDADARDGTVTSAHDVGTHAPTAPAPTGGPRPGRRSAAGALTGRAPADVGYLALAILVALAVAAVVALPFRVYRPPPAPTPSDLPAEVTVRDLDDSLTDAQEAELTRRIARIPSYRAWRIVVQLRDGEPLDARGRTTTWESVLRQERPDLYTEVNSTPELAPDLLVVDLDSSTNLDSIHSAAEFDEKDERNRRQLQDADDMLDTRMMSGDPVEAVPWALTWLLERMAEPVGTDRTTLTRTAGVIASTGAAVAVLPLARILHEYLVRRRAAWTRAREQYSRIVLGVEELRPTVELAAAQGGYGPAALTRWRVLARRSGELSRLVFDAGAWTPGPRTRASSRSGTCTTPSRSSPCSKAGASAGTAAGAVGDACTTPRSASARWPGRSSWPRTSIRPWPPCGACPCCCATADRRPRICSPRTWPR